MKTRVTKAEMEQAIEAQLSPLAYRVFTRRIDDLGKENDPIGLIFVLQKNEQDSFFMNYFDLSILSSLTAEVSVESFLQTLFIESRTYYDKQKLIEELTTLVYLAYYPENSCFSSYKRQCYILWVEHVESILKIDIMDKTIGEAKIDEVLDSISTLSYWFSNNAFRMTKALEDPESVRKMTELKEQFDKMWQQYSSQDFQELRNAPMISQLPHA